VDSLCKACDLEIRTAIRKAIGNNPELRDIEGIQEELRSFARKGIEKAAERYDPSLGATENLQQAEKNVLEVVDEVAQRLGNTRDIARASYISPRVIDHYMEGSVIAYYGELIEEIVAEQEGLTEGEEALLELLNKKLRRELRKAA
jgi:DNA topoisomerase IB